MNLTKKQIIFIICMLILIIAVTVILTKQINLFIVIPAMLAIIIMLLNLYIGKKL